MSTRGERELPGLTRKQIEAKQRANYKLGLDRIPEQYLGISIQVDRRGHWRVEKTTKSGRTNRMVFETLFAGASWDEEGASLEGALIKAARALYEARRQQ